MQQAAPGYFDLPKSSREMLVNLKCGSGQGGTRAEDAKLEIRVRNNPWPCPAKITAGMRKIK